VTGGVEPGGVEPGGVEAQAQPGEAVTPGERGEAEAQPGEATPGEAVTPEEPTLPEEFETLAEDMRGSMLGKPAQRVTGLIILVLLFFAAMLGLAALRDSGALGDPASPGPSGTVEIVRLA
jgi:hypothetical protein